MEFPDQVISRAYLMKTVWHIECPKALWKASTAPFVVSSIGLLVSGTSTTSAYRFSSNAAMSDLTLQQICVEPSFHRMVAYRRA